ncbi:MAG: GNAT family N-acetyltransferase [bacterium]
MQTEKSRETRRADGAARLQRTGTNVVVAAPLRRRAATGNHAVRILPLDERYFDSQRLCLDEVARERKFLCLLEAPSPTDTRNFFSAALAKKCPFFLAVAGRRVVGWCDIHPACMQGFGHVGRLGIGILAEFRGQGIGRRLMRTALTAARRSGLKRIELEVFATNTKAIRLYKDLGFAVEGRKRKARKLDGRYDDIILMARLFR